MLLNNFKYHILLKINVLIANRILTVKGIWIIRLNIFDAAFRLNQRHSCRNYIRPMPKKNVLKNRVGSLNQGRH